MKYHVEANSIRETPVAPPSEKEGRLRERMKSVYSEGTVTGTESIGCFRCGK